MAKTKGKTILGKSHFSSILAKWQNNAHNLANNHRCRSDFKALIRRAFATCVRIAPSFLPRSAYAICYIPISPANTCMPNHAGCRCLCCRGLTLALGSSRISMFITQQSLRYAIYGSELGSGDFRQGLPLHHLPRLLTASGYGDSGKQSHVWGH